MKIDPKDLVVTHQDMTVDPEGMPHLLEILGADATPLQMIRELTQNSIDAIGRRPGPGRVLWTADRDQKNKLTIIDNGDGMTGPELVDYINKLAKSASRKSLTDHFGIGAKITAGIRNPHGLVYESWKDGKYARIVLCKNPDTGRYGLKPLKRRDGTMGVWTNVAMSDKPQRIINQHGTKITLMGFSEDDNTTLAPTIGSEFTGENWLARYLNSHYAELPAGVDVRVSTKPTYEFHLAETVTPRLNYLNDNSVQHGVVPLAGVNAHWWILKPVKPTTVIEGKGHVGVMFQGEVYETAFRRAGAALLSSAGIVAGPDRVVLYFEPISKEGQFVKASTARNGVRVESEAPPLVDWATMFANNIPDEINAYMDGFKGDLSKDSEERLRDRLTKHQHLFFSDGFRGHFNGEVSVVSAVSGIQKTPIDKPPGPGPGGPTGTRTSNPNNLESRLRKKMEAEDSDQKAKRIRDLSMPGITWLDGAHDEQLKDCAAKYEPNSHTIIINETFRGYEELLASIQEKYLEARPAKRKVDLLNALVKEYFAQVLVEAVWGILHLSNKGAFLREDYIKNYLTPQGLTMAVMAKIEIGDNVSSAMRHRGFTMQGPK